MQVKHGLLASAAALGEMLESRGVMESVRARLRAEVFHAIESHVRHALFWMGSDGLR